MALEKIIFPVSEKCSKIVEWKVKCGSLISKGRVLLHYQVDCSDGTERIQKLKASKVGTVRALLLQQGSTVKPGDEFLEMESCSHPTVMRDLCAECGADLSNEKQTASVPMVHCVPELKVSLEQAQQIGKADEEHLINHRKLVLLVDLDQTLIHTTNDDIPPNLKDVHHFQLYGSASPWYHTRLRPLTLKFLHEISNIYELHICTFGARSYAHTIAKILDPDEKLFSHRILSRDECFDPNSKTANLKALFPCGDHMVCIIDDREDVWNFAPNLIAVKPYHFFQHTGDIHAPPGLDKHEQDGSGYTQTAEPPDPTTAEDENEGEENNKSEETESKNEESDADDESEKVPSETEKLHEEQTKSEVNSNAAIKSVAQSDPKNEPEKVDSEPAELASKSGTEIRSKILRAQADLKQKSNKVKVYKVKSHIEEHSAKRESEEKSDAQGTATEEEIKPEINNTEEPMSVDDKEENVSDEESPEDESFEKSGELIDIPDPDDYLLYLQDILERIHLEYYTLYDKQGSAPNMREVVPSVKRRVLADQSLVFSGVVPTHVPLANSRSAQIARNLGAEVTEQVIPGETTHLVAARPGTAKVNEARRAGTGIHIVSPDWLACTAERWERAEERLFPLSRTSKRGIPENSMRMHSNSMAESLNPLLALSSEDIKSMDQEVEDIFNETDDESAMDRDADSELDEEEDDEEKKNEIKLESCEVLTEINTDNEDDTIKKKRDLPVDEDTVGRALKLFKDSEYVETPTSDAEDSGDESELSKMGLALEREFLAD